MFVSKRRYEAVKAPHEQLKQDSEREQRDLRHEIERLNTENAAYHQAINEAQAVISRLEVQALALQKENASLTLQLQEATKPRTRRKAGQAVNVGEGGTK